MNNEEENVNSYIEKGEILLNDNKYDDALVFFNRVIECPQFVLLLNSIKYETYFNKGFTLWKLNKNIEAIECYNRAIEINPINSLSYLFKSFSLANLSMYEEANLHLLRHHQLIRLQPEIRTLIYAKLNIHILLLIFFCSFHFIEYFMYVSGVIFIHFKVFYFIYSLYDFFICFFLFFINLDYRFSNSTFKLIFFTYLYLVNSNGFFALFMWVFLTSFNYSSFFSILLFYLWVKFLQFDPKSVQYQSINEALKKEMNSEFMSHVQTPP